jgi:hypothetical protein
MNTTAICCSPAGDKALARFLRRGRRTRGPLSCIALLLFIFSLSPVSSWASPAPQAHPTASQVKAAYLFNFGKFVRWQSDRAANGDTLEICVLGKDPFGSILDSTVAGESIDSRKIAVKRIARVQDASACSILFISSSEESRLGAILAAVQRSSVLTVSDIPHFAEHGGIIEFVFLQDKIRFEVNRSAAEQSHLVLSSELLKVASKVIEKTTVEGQP